MIEDAFWLTLVSAGVFLSYLPHLYFSTQRYRSEHSYRAFRGLFVAIMLQIGLLRIVLGAAARISPSTHTPVDVLSAITAPVLSLFLLTGGIVLAFSWVSEARARAR